jgi:hypothetical protein
MVSWVYDKKFLAGTQFLFGTLLFTTGEDGNLELQVRGPTSRQWAPIYDKAPYYPTTTTSASDGLRSSLNPCAGPHALADLGAQVPAFRWDMGPYFMRNNT